MKEVENKLEEVQLSAFERIVLMNLLPERASRHKGLLITQIRDKLSLSDEELEKYDVTVYQNGNIMFGNEVGDKPFTEFKAFEFPRQKMVIIRDSLKKADKEERLPTDPKVFNLYDKIVEEV